MSGPCEFCGLAHGKICPSVRAIEYHANGKVKRVEFMRPVDCHPISLVPMLPPPTIVPQPYYPPVAPLRWQAAELPQIICDTSILPQNGSLQ